MIQRAAKVPLIFAALSVPLLNLTQLLNASRRRRATFPAASALLPASALAAGMPILTVAFAGQITDFLDASNRPAVRRHKTPFSNQFLTHSIYAVERAYLKPSIHIAIIGIRKRGATDDHCSRPNP
jgi:hypothetical protein